VGAFEGWGGVSGWFGAVNRFWRDCDRQSVMRAGVVQFLDSLPCHPRHPCGDSAHVLIVAWRTAGAVQSFTGTSGRSVAGLTICKFPSPRNCCNECFLQCSSSGSWISDALEMFARAQKQAPGRQGGSRVGMFSEVIGGEGTEGGERDPKAESGKQKAEGRRQMGPAFTGIFRRGRRGRWDASTKGH
jgi:hypothetical protein